MLRFFQFHINQINAQLQRSLLGFVRNKSDLRISLVQAPLLAIAFYLVFTEHQGTFAHSRHLFELESSQTVLFLSVLSAVWFGTSKAMLEIPSYWRLYLQERISFLHDFDFVTARFIYLGMLAVMQCVLFAVVFHLLFIILPTVNAPEASGLTSNDATELGLYAVLRLDVFIFIISNMVLISLASVALALAISSFMSTPSAASAFLPFYLILQILLSGSVIKPAVEMNNLVYNISSITSSRWGYELMTSDLKRVLVDSVAIDTNNSAFAQNGNKLTDGLTQELLEYDYAQVKVPDEASFEYLLSDSVIYPTASKVIITHLSNSLRFRPENPLYRDILSALQSTDKARAVQLLEQLDERTTTNIVSKINENFRRNVESIVKDVKQGQHLAGVRLALWQDFLANVEGRPLLFTHYHLWKCYVALLAICILGLLITKVGLMITSKRLSEGC
ncbi:ABC transporter permease [Alteromonas sp. ASW11-36]|uniref:ABC transporter permease n=1 Tax=Alteromonas arenosi TaxID=3055817 RepID=A0ABT7SW86_9ALTE|nr:ABC transporter permease [Alteromonas sp. ASW11-36]MDM7860451.1 ABC transporter permease [Alteromonas sp. ASW11-36]